jgi:hypothetical protein
MITRTLKVVGLTLDIPHLLAACASHHLLHAGRSGHRLLVSIEKMVNQNNAPCDCTPRRPTKGHQSLMISNLSWKKSKINTNPVDYSRGTPNDYGRTIKGTFARAVTDRYPENFAIPIQDPIRMM